MKNKIKEAKEITTTTGKNVIEFVQAASLVIVAVYSGLSVHQGKAGSVAWMVAASAAIIAVRGSYELLRHFNKKG